MLISTISSVMTTMLNLLPSYNSKPNTGFVNYNAYYSSLALAAKRMIYFEDYKRIEMSFEVQNSFSKTAFFARDAFVDNFSWAVPSVKAIEEICKFADGKLILEVGAGNCFWAFLIRLNGQRIVASDNFSSHGATKSRSFIPEMFPMDGVEAIQKIQSNVLFICWPGFEDPMAANCLRAFTGNKFIYIGEGRDGCTADDGFFDLLEQDWNKVGHVDIPTWFGIHDSLSFYERKENPTPTPKEPVEEPWSAVESRKGGKISKLPTSSFTAQGTHFSSNKFSALDDDDC